MEIEIETILMANGDSRKPRTFVLSQHAASRMEKRRLSISEIMSTLRYGSKRAIDRDCWEYKFAGVIAIVNKEDNAVLTVYPEPGFGIDLNKVEITPEMELEHKRSCSLLRIYKNKWTSHNVAVIDQSGSMRKMDIDEAITRSDLVWLCLAVDIVYNGIKSGERKSTDVLSIIVMKDDAEIIIDRQPFDWILYNKLIDIMNTKKPSTGGRFIPALDVAQELLFFNRSKNCALSLLFLSDGKPSDQFKSGKLSNTHIQGRHFEAMKKHIGPRIEELASLLGKRLNICFFPIGPEQERSSSEFGVMEYMADQARAYECPVICEPASLHAKALTAALRKMSTTTTNTMTTISELPANCTIRNFVKMRQDHVGSPMVSETWETCRKRRIVRFEYRKDKGFVRCSKHLFHPTAIGLAWEKRWFGEGKERIAKELRELGPDGLRFVGPPMVLKASITISKDINVDSKDFHKGFCKTQIKAEVFAKRFNDAAASLPVPVPRIEFLPCWVYDIEQSFFLVEPQLDVLSYKKFNDNNGGVYSTPSQSTLAAKNVAFARSLGTRGDRGEFAPILDTLAEESDDEECSETHEGTEVGEVPGRVSPRFSLEEEIAASDVMQAFSCFSYWLSSRKFLVCDLQGTFTDGECPLYQLTDPVIHTGGEYLAYLKDKYGNAPRYGRTDSGQKGVDAFFATHKCSKLCRMLQSRRIRSNHYNSSIPEYLSRVLDD